MVYTAKKDMWKNTYSYRCLLIELLDGRTMNETATQLGMCPATFNRLLGRGKFTAYSNPETLERPFRLSGWTEEKLLRVREACYNFKDDTDDDIREVKKQTRGSQALRDACYKRKSKQGISDQPSLTTTDVRGRTVNTTGFTTPTSGIIKCLTRLASLNEALVQEYKHLQTLLETQDVKVSLADIKQLIDQ